MSPPLGLAVTVSQGAFACETLEAEADSTVATVWSNIVMTAGLAEGEISLVHGGAGGVGTTAFQIAKALGLASLLPSAVPPRARGHVNWVLTSAVIGLQDGLAGELNLAELPADLFGAFACGGLLANCGCPRPGTTA